MKSLNLEEAFEQTSWERWLLDNNYIKKDEHDKIVQSFILEQIELKNTVKHLKKKINNKCI